MTLWIDRPATLLSADRGEHAYVNRMARIALLASSIYALHKGRKYFYGGVTACYVATYLYKSTQQKWKMSPEEEEFSLNLVTQASKSNDAINPSVFDYGRGFDTCSRMKDESPQMSVTEKVSVGSEADLSLYINQVPDTSGCGKPPSFDDLKTPAYDDNRICMFGSCVVSAPRGAGGTYL